MRCCKVSGTGGAADDAGPDDDAANAGDNSNNAATADRQRAIRPAVERGRQGRHGFMLRV